MISFFSLNLKENIEIYKSMTNAAINSDFIIWPESAIPLFSYQLTELLNPLSVNAKNHNSTIFASIPFMNLKTKKYPIWRLDTLFSKNKLNNLEIINDGGWHFTNIKTPEDLYEKFKNFGHHDEFDDSGITLEKLKEYIDNGIVFYNHKLDKKNPQKWNFDYKLKRVDNSFLPKYLVDNKSKYINWFKTLND